MTDVSTNRVNPLVEIRRVERSAAMAIEEATREAAAAVREARARARALVERATERGEKTALRRYEEGMRQARDDANEMLAGADDRVAAVRRRAGPSLDAAVAAVLEYVLPDPERG